MAVVANAVITGALAILRPGILAVLVARHPAPGPVDRLLGGVAVGHPRPRSSCRSSAGSATARASGRACSLMVPVFLIGGLLIARTQGTRSPPTSPRCGRPPPPAPRTPPSAPPGRSPLLTVRNLDVAYGDVQVLFGVDLEVDEGEIVALLGTNGAGKSTLLKAISGVVEADRGAVLLDGREITHAPPHEIAALGIAQVPGGQGVFPTPDASPRTCGWRRGSTAATGPRPRRRIERAYELFPVLARAGRRRRRRPVRRPAADARPRHGAHRPSPSCC